MLTGIHFILSYKCTLECDHCFIYSGPNAKATFTLKDIKKVLTEAIKIKTVEWIYFEGGEPFLFYPLMLEGIGIASELGFNVGVVTNGYFATSEEDAVLWLKPLYNLGVSDLSISDDLYHNERTKDSPAKRAYSAAKKLGLPVSSICIEKPAVKKRKGRTKGSPVIGGGVMFRGRAAEKLTKDLPQRRWDKLNKCPYEELKDPERVHIDPYGNVHLCQGLCMGNIQKKPLSTMIRNYNAEEHPVCAPLIEGGPALLAAKFNVQHDEGYVDECHFCYNTRLALINRFPNFLTPKQVYGLE
ncbi:MAG: radical SAM protein [Ignavibacteriaceae bacterium]